MADGMDGWTDVEIEISFQINVKWQFGRKLEPNQSQA